MRGHRLVSDQDLPIRMRCIPDQLRIWSILSGNALIILLMESDTSAIPLTRPRLWKSFRMEKFWQIRRFATLYSSRRWELRARDRNYGVARLALLSTDVRRR